MGAQSGLVPTPPTSGSEYQRWSAIYAGDDYYYGRDPGPLVRRAVRYHRHYRPRGGTVLDAGCGEGQDLAFLAENGYVATGIELTSAGLRKAERLLQSCSLEAELVCADLRDYASARPFDLVLASNSLPFLGEEGEECLQKLREAVAPGGVIGISLFARPSRDALSDLCDDRGLGKLSHGLWLISLEELLCSFSGWQMLEASHLWQWNPHTQAPQPFATLIARNTPAPPPPIPLP